MFLTSAKTRTIFGNTTCNKISRFVTEMPVEMIEGYEEVVNQKVEMKFKDSEYEWQYGESKKENSFIKNTIKNENNNVDLTRYKIGIAVFHKKFGEGIIQDIEQEGEDLKVDINFEKVGKKRLMAKYAGLEIIE